MSVLVQDVLPRSDHVEHAPIQSAARRAGERRHDSVLSDGLLGFAIVALSVYLCLGVSVWFLPLSALLVGVVVRSFATGRSGSVARSQQGRVNQWFAEVPILADAGPR